MPPATHLVVELHVIDVDAAVWCPTCLLPSAVQVTWAGANPDTLVTIVRGVSTFCIDCGLDVLDEP